jgi:outer membrane protein, heavy metal efflux system
MASWRPFPASARAQPRRMPATIAALACLALAAPLRTTAADALTEAEAVRHALARPQLLDALQGGVDAATADAIAAGLRPNPSFDYEHERTDSIGGDATEQKARLSQAFDLSGRRALRREAAEGRVEAVRQDAAARRSAVAIEVRSAFHEALSFTRRIEILLDWEKTLAQVEDTLARLERGGEVSGYDRRRIARERLVAQARLAEAQAADERARERLAALIGPRADVALAGEVLPPELPALETLLVQLPARGDLRALAARVQAHESDRRAASRGWIPDVTVGAGVKRIEEPGHSDSGLLLTLSVPIPLFDRGQAAGQRASAQARATQGEYQLALAKAEGEVRGTWRQAKSLREATLRFAKASLPASRELARIAEAAYRGGETRILELLDAYRSRVEAETDALELQMKARRARIDLESNIGADPQ